MTNSKNYSVNFSTCNGLTISIGNDLYSLYQNRCGNQSFDGWLRTKMLMLAGLTEDEDGSITEVSRQHLEAGRTCPHCSNPVFRGVVDHGTPNDDCLTMRDFIEGYTSTSEREALTKYFAPMRKSPASGLSMICTGNDIGLKAIAKVGGINSYVGSELRETVLPIVHEIVRVSTAAA